MTEEISYKIQFPEIEIEGIHAKAAILAALKYFASHTNEVKWIEVDKE